MEGAATMAGLLAGAATRVITPSLDGSPVFLAGFGNNRRATGVHLDLRVSALALQHGATEVILVACDLIGLDLSEVVVARERLGARGIDPGSLVVTCTHTHSGPDTIGLWGETRAVSGVDRSYLSRVHEAIAAVAEEALGRVAPARLRVGMSRLEGHVLNHRTPDLIDDEVAVCQFVAPDDQVIATLLNLACHPEVLVNDSTLLSPDYAGVACQAIETAVGGVALHVSGALGGMLSPATTERTPASAERMGRVYAEAALAAVAGSPAREVERLTLRRAELELPMENPLFVAGQEAGILPRRLTPNGTVTTTLVFIDLGPAQIITVPGELLPRLGFELKALLPGPCRVVVGLADDELGYILPDDEYVHPVDYADPGAQYEESMSLGPRTGSLVMAAARNLITGDR
jgi:hypothetical protein